MSAAPELSIVVPARDEEPNLAPLVEEVRREVIEAGVDAELIVVDDGSHDASVARLAALAHERGWLRPLRLARPLGKSAALAAGIRAARGPIVGTLDADLQNDPADLVRLLPLLRSGEAGFVQGVRERREDSRVRKAASAVGRAARRLLLGDVTRDTGCATRLLPADLARQLPLELRGLHRFLPHVARSLGARVVEVPVRHRPRLHGRSHYGLLDRAGAGLRDCFGVAWLLSRRVALEGQVVAVTPDPPAEAAPGEGAGGSGGR